MKLRSIKLQLLENGEILWLTLNKPKGNILNAAMMSELIYSLKVNKDNRNLKMVILQGSGGNFSFGASIEEHRPENVSSMLKIFHSLVRQVAGFPVPVACLIEGQCLGGAFEVALCSHFVFVTSDSIMACPEIKLGVFPPVLAAIGTCKLGSSWTLKLMLTGCNIPVKEALACGFVNKIIKDNEPNKIVIDWFKKNLQQLSAFSLRQATKALNKSSKIIEQLETNLKEVEKQYLKELMAGYDSNEGILSYIEKRKPVWRNC